MDLHKAIKAIHTNAVVIKGNDQNDIVAKDSSDNNIAINWTQVNAWVNQNQYKIDRAEEYPSIQEQLDDIFHNGIDGWKATIQTIKDKYPKE